ncbi:MAG: anthranilate phosphoribosyltransferase [Thermoleophilia bacterium]
MIDSSFPRLDYTRKRFADALADLLRQEAGDPHARVNLRDFFGRVEGWEYETLRKQISGERSLKPEAIEAMAQALSVAPEYFQEFRKHQIDQAIATHPELVDLFYDLLVSRAKSLDATAVPLVSRVLDQIAARKDLDADLASRVLELIVQGQVSDVQTAAFLMGLRTKGETGEEIFGFARTMRKYGTPVEIAVDEPLVDIVSTGGDRLATFNISTTAAFVAAGAGVRIAKHGSRGQTSHAGSADLLQALGARIDLAPESVAACVRDVGIGFMYAPLHYAPIRHMVPMRRNLNMRTVFNFIAPILNPAGVKRQLTGVSDARYLTTLAAALCRLGSEHALFAHGDDGLDEISVTGPTTLVELRDGTVGEPFSVAPEDFGLQRWPLMDLAGGDPLKNAEVTRRVLAGEPGAPLDIVLLNAGAAVYLAGRATTIAAGVDAARESVESGRALERLTAFVDYTRSVKPPRATYRKGSTW